MAGKVDKLMGGVFRENDAKNAAGADLYLKIDQTVPQNVINDAPQFDEGIIIKNSKKIYLDGL